MTIEHLYAIQLPPLKNATSAVTPANMSLVPGSPRARPGYIMIAKYSDSPMSWYDQMIYVPGRYQFNKCPKFHPHFSVQHAWTNYVLAFYQWGGRMGYPEELMTFKWVKRGSNTTVKVYYCSPMGFVEDCYAPWRLIISATFVTSAGAAPPGLLAQLQAPQMQWSEWMSGPQLVTTSYVASPVQPTAVKVVSLHMNSTYFVGQEHVDLVYQANVPALAFGTGAAAVVAAPKLLNSSLCAL